MTSEQAFERMLQQHRERVRSAIADRTLVTPREVYATLCPTQAYDARVAEAVCGHLAALGFMLQGDGTWSLSGLTNDRRLGTHVGIGKGT